jgi:phosphoserine phosphatase
MTRRFAIHAKLFEIADNGFRSLPYQEYQHALISAQSSTAIRLSPREFAESVLSLRPSIAVFDCDGTLWSVDAGYEFMLWSIAQGIVSRNASDWIDSRYRLYRAGDVSELAMCGEMVQIYDGLREVEIRKAAAEFFDSRVKAKIFPELRALVLALKSAGTELWAVSSTNNWVIEEGLRGFDIGADRILAARVQVTGGVITSDLIDVPTDERKAVALTQAGVTTPDAVFGNSIHDFAMLQMARHPFPVNPSAALRKLAIQNGWPIYYPEAIFPEQP